MGGPIFYRFLVAFLVNPEKLTFDLTASIDLSESLLRHPLPYIENRFKNTPCLSPIKKQDRGPYLRLFYSLCNLQRA
jgi:hypothetical protein